MRKHLPLLLIVAAALLGYVLLQEGEEETAPEPELSDDTHEPVDVPRGLEAGLEAGGAEPEKTKRRKGRPVPRNPDPRTWPRGTLLITPVGPDGKPVDGRQLRMRVEPVRAGDFPTKLGRWNEDTGTWRFRKVPAGTVEVLIFSDHVVRTVQRVKVAADRDNQVTVPVEVGGAIKYDVILYDKTRPEKVELTLYDGEDKPKDAWFQVRSTKKLSAPRLAKTITQGPEGFVLGLSPGRYRLKALSENDEWDEAEVRVEPGKTHEVHFEIRR